MLRDFGFELWMCLFGVLWIDEVGCAVLEPCRYDYGRAVMRCVLGDGIELALLHDVAAIVDQVAVAFVVAVVVIAVDNVCYECDVRERIEHLCWLRCGLLDVVDEEW